MKKLNLILLSFLLAFCFACQNEPKSKDTWFVGKIDNPRVDYVVIKQSRFTLDTAKLDDNNFFHYKFPETVKEGVYSFVHDETYSFYITPGDSLLMLANTLDFENSIYFTNTHAEENNFLKEINTKIYSNKFKWPELCDSSFDDFNEKISIHQNELKASLDEFIAKNEKTSAKFKRVIKNAIIYNELYNRENYLYAQISTASDESEILDTYYIHREYIPYEVDTFEVYFPYYRLLHTYFDNMVLDSLNRKTSYSKSDVELKRYKLNLIDKLIDNQGVKNNMLYTTVRRYLLYATDSVEEREILDQHNNLNTCNFSITELENLSKFTIAMKPGKKLPEIRLLTHDNLDTYLENIIKRPSLLYFWSDKDIQHHKQIHKRIEELKRKYPEYDFIGFNLDNHFKNWRRTVNQLAYDTDFEYQFYYPKQAIDKLVINFKNKAIIVDEKGVIFNANNHLYQADIENELLMLLNM